MGPGFRRDDESQAIGLYEGGDDPPFYGELASLCDAKASQIKGFQLSLQGEIVRSLIKHRFPRVGPTGRH
jgi:hypothetical protein